MSKDGETTKTTNYKHQRISIWYLALKCHWTSLKCLAFFLVQVLFAANMMVSKRYLWIELYDTFWCVSCKDFNMSLSCVTFGMTFRGTNCSNRILHDMDNSSWGPCLSEPLLKCLGIDWSETSQSLIVETNTNLFISSNGPTLLMLHFQLAMGQGYIQENTYWIRSTCEVWESLDVRDIKSNASANVFTLSYPIFLFQCTALP